MAFWKRAAQSIHALLEPSPPSTGLLLDSLEDIREAMLDLLGPQGQQVHPSITRKVRFAADLQALWYLRSELMATLAELHGETHARQQMQSISNQFGGLLPGGLASRPSPLS